MLIRTFILLVTVHALASARPLAVDCGAVLSASRAEQVRVPEWQAGRRVTGRERLYFHSAPNAACRQRELFVVQGDTLQAHNEYGIYTEVYYVHPKTGRQSIGWVETGRLQETMAGKGAAR